MATARLFFRANRTIRVTKNSFDDAATPAPAISSLNYDQGDTLGGGQPIVITGTDLGGATGVSFGGTAATITANDATTVTCTLPAKAAGATTVTVTTAGGTSNGLSFTYWEPGQLSSTTGVWENYTGQPWVARGGSVGGNLQTAGTPPSVGAGAGGFSSSETVAGAGGIYLRSVAPNYIENYASFTGGIPGPGPGSTAWVLFKPNSAGAAAATIAPYINRGLLSTNAGGYFLVSHTVDGFCCNVYDGAYESVTAPCTLGTGNGGVGAWHMGVFVYDTATSQVSVDGSLLADASVSQGLGLQPGDDTYFMQCNVDYSVGNPFDGEILAWGVTKDVSTDADVTKLRKWAQQRFGVTV